jgi:hypothetical protein
MTQVSVNGALLRTLSYDSPLDSNFSHYTLGRLTGVTHPNTTIGGARGTGIPGLQYPFGDQVPGAVDTKKGFDYEAAKQKGCK